MYICMYVPMYVCICTYYTQYIWYLVLVLVHWYWYTGTGVYIQVQVHMYMYIYSMYVPTSYKYKLQAVPHNSTSTAGYDKATLPESTYRGAF